MKFTPQSARGYILLAAFFIALPTIGNFYKGHTGRFLIASSMIGSGEFQRSVVYVVEHGLFTGARGYIVNKPLEGRKGVFYGGPVETDDHRYTMHYAGRSREYHGYAGWTPLQLEYEIIKGGWSVLPGDQATIFTDDYERLWRMLDVRARGESAPTAASIY